ncbi:hypothetical protein CDV31_006816 [Fusarium ambrosium]|nr:hypothetical protein CDV31_006816 [Fusarium ambrosium]
MCDFTKNYYIYTSCTDPGTHFCKTSTDGSRKHACPKGPHERYIASSIYLIKIEHARREDRAIDSGQ